MAILLNRWIFPIGGASAVEGLLSMGPTPSSYEICRQQDITQFSGFSKILSALGQVPCHSFQHLAAGHHNTQALNNWEITCTGQNMGVRVLSYDVFKGAHHKQMQH